MEKLYKNLPDSPGVYIFKDSRGRILYVGKAGNLKRRVSSYFQRPHDSRLENLVGKIKKIDYRETDTALEALILEAELIKKYKPPFNVREKDDKSFLYVEITNEKFPRVLLVRGKEATSDKQQATKLFGPFTSASNIREALKILRKIFPWSTHKYNANDTKTNIRMMRKKLENKHSRHSHTFVDSHYPGASRPCFDYEIGLCPGTCVGAITRKDYLKNIKDLKLFFGGEKGKILRNLEKEMAAASKNLEFEKAVKLRRQLFALQHIQDTALISDDQFENWKLEIGNSAQRIEGYDVSNISGTSAVGSMVVFRGSEPDKNEYRKFRIRTITQSDDVGMLREVLRRRFYNDWPLPDLILIDGGRGQVNAAKKVFEEFSLKIPVVGIAKGAKRKKNEFIGKIPAGMEKKTLVNVRNEAHRFAIGYHKKLRSAKFFI